MDVFEYGNPNASVILVQMIGDHDIEMIDHEFDLIQKAVSDELCLIACKVDDWNRDLSPWKAPAVFKSESFGENAAKTLSEVLTYIGEKKHHYPPPRKQYKSSGKVQKQSIHKIHIYGRPAYKQ